MTELIRKENMTSRTRTAMEAVLSGNRRGGFLLFFGPAVIASVAYMDPGNYATNIQAGAGYGYALLWVVLGANLIAMLFQAISARVGIVTGKNLAELSRENFSKPVTIAMWIVSGKPIQFYYHYLLSGAFLMGCLALALDALWTGTRTRWRWATPAALALAAGMFAWFYPIISSAPLPEGRPAYVKWMWLHSWR